MTQTTSECRERTSSGARSNRRTHSPCEFQGQSVCLRLSFDEAFHVGLLGLAQVHGRRWQLEKPGA